MIFHSIGWDLEATARLRSTRSAPTLPGREYDDDAFNAGNVAARQHLGWQAALDELAAAHVELANLLTTISPTEALHDGRYIEWAAGRASDFADHTAQLRAWRIE